MYSIYSAALCEKRIIFVGNSIQNVSELVLAAVAMLYPFRWQHQFIPVTPPILLDFAFAPMPYIIGMKTEHFNQFKKKKEVTSSQIK